MEIHRQIVEVYSEGAANEGNAWKLCWLFKEGRINVHDKERSVRQYLVTDYFKGKVITEI
jgi:exoribonuclease R